MASIIKQGLTCSCKSQNAKHVAWFYFGFVLKKYLWENSNTPYVKRKRIFHGI